MRPRRHKQSPEYLKPAKNRLQAGKKSRALRGGPLRLFLVRRLCFAEF